MTARKSSESSWGLIALRISQNFNCHMRNEAAPKGSWDLQSDWQIDVSFKCVCPLIDDKLRHINIVKVELFFMDLPLIFRIMHRGERNSLALSKWFIVQLLKCANKKREERSETTFSWIRLPVEVYARVRDARKNSPSRAFRELGVLICRCIFQCVRKQHLLKFKLILCSIFL